MKKRIYEHIETPGFDAYRVIERWEIGNKWYQKCTTSYIMRGTIEENDTVVQWDVMDFDTGKKLWLKETTIWENGAIYDSMPWNRKYQHVG